MDRLRGAWWWRWRRDGIWRTLQRVEVSFVVGRARVATSENPDILLLSEIFEIWVCLRRTGSCTNRRKDLECA